MIAHNRQGTFAIVFTIAVCLLEAGCEPPPNSPAATSPPPPPPPPTVAKVPVDPPPAEPPDSSTEETQARTAVADPVDIDESPEEKWKEPLTPQQARAFFEELGARISYEAEDDCVKAYLNRSQVEDEHLRFLKYLPKLGVVNLSGRPITDAGLSHLGEIDTLQRIYLARTNVSDQAAEQLTQTLPDVKLLK